jgi:hypothetical protein
VQKPYNPDAVVNKGEYSNYCTIRKARTYVDVWNRIKYDPRAGVPNTGPLPNEHFIESFRYARNEVVK